MEAVVLHRVEFLEYFCPKQGQDFKASAATLYPNMGQVLSPPGGCHTVELSSFFRVDSNVKGLIVVMFCPDLPVKRCEGDRA